MGNISATVETEAWTGGDRRGSEPDWEVGDLIDELEMERKKMHVPTQPVPDSGLHDHPIYLCVCTVVRERCSLVLGFYVDIQMGFKALGDNTMERIVRSFGFPRLQGMEEWTGISWHQWMSIFYVRVKKYDLEWLQCNDLWREITATTQHFTRSPLTGHYDWWMREVSVWRHRKRIRPIRSHLGQIFILLSAVLDWIVLQERVGGVERTLWPLLLHGHMKQIWWMAFNHLCVWKALGK